MPRFSRRTLKSTADVGARLVQIYIQRPPPYTRQDFERIVIDLIMVSQRMTRDEATQELRWANDRLKRDLKRAAKLAAATDGDSTTPAAKPS